MIEGQEQLNPLVTPEEIYARYPQLFSPEIISNDITGEIEPYYLETKDGNKRDSFRVILTPSGAVAVGGFLRNIWNVTTLRRNGVDKGVNIKNIVKNDKDSRVLEQINEFLKDERIYEVEGKDVFVKINGFRYCLIPFFLYDQEDITLLEKFLEHKLALKGI